IIFKIYERLILFDLSNKHKIRKSLHLLQGGNRRGRGVDVSIGTLSVVCETAKKNKDSLFCGFLDIRKAFDTVWRKGLIYKVLANFNVSPNLCKIITAIYKNSKSAIRNRPFINKPYDILNGVLQGSVLSPVLFAVFVDDLIHKLQDSGFGAKSPDINTLISAIFYCDDVVVTANSIENLQKLMKICEEHSKHWAYNFNAKKCKLMIYDHHSNNTDYLLNNLTSNDKQKINNEYKNKLNKNPKNNAPMLFTSAINDNKTISGISLNWEEIDYHISEIPDCILNRYKKHLKFFKNDIINNNYNVMWDNTV
ncbi:MAG: hypothetical protein GY737_17500, partial [Desulfobacteraceae bacterium]|nr:hypothetical protein [Desulfobacteraceae bacterium]